MQKARRYERIFLVEDVAVRPNGRKPLRFPAEMFNISMAGAGVFSSKHFAPGEIVGVEMNLPADGGRRKFLLYGTVRHTKAQPEGNVLGIEFVVGEDAGDYEEFERYMQRRAARAPSGRRGGFTLIEACIAMTVICLLVTMGMPLYTRAVEHSRVDVASAKLRTVWSAQRVFWLENRTYATDLGQLDSMDLLDPTVVESQVGPDAVFVYQIVSADDESFMARAMRNGSGVWVGQIEIDESGKVTGAINGSGGQRIEPPP